jgi:hypothetical protein
LAKGRRDRDRREEVLKMGMMGLWKVMETIFMYLLIKTFHLH